MRKLSACAPTVNQSISISSLSRRFCRFGDDVIPERVGENENHRNHETVDGRGLDHRQADEQSTGDGGGGVGLLRQRGKRRRDRAPFAQRRSHAAETSRESGGG